MKKSQVCLSWLWVTLCAASIFAIVPLARPIQNLVSHTLGRASFGYFVLICVAFFLTFMLWWLFFRLKIRQVSRFLWVALVGLAYLYFTLKLWDHPEEAVHFLEYGLLSFLLYRALRHHLADISIYFSSLFLGSFVGLIDEILQWITPKRYWDFRDVGLNALAVLLFQIALAFGFAPKGISRCWTPRSLRFASFALAANLILIGLCLSNTPERVAKYSRLIPCLSFLEKEEIMHDFQIKKHVIPEIGIFYSRLELEQLKALDQERGEDFAHLLLEWANRPYEEFLRTFSAQREPFLHEFRVRLFRRDQKIKEANQLSPGRKRDKALLIAYRENLFLEKYFSRTLKLSGNVWPLEFTQKLAKQVSPQKKYRSPVGASFWLLRSELSLWMGILGAILFLALINLVYTFKDKRKRKNNKPAGGIEPSTC